MDFKKLNERYLETKMYKDRWLGLYTNLYNYVLPDRDAYNVKWNYRDDGKPTTVQIWDFTAVLAAYQRANDLHGLLLPKDRVWGKLSLDENLYDKALVQAYEPMMEEVNQRIFFYINQSNLAQVVAESNLDLVGGTAGIWVESKSDDEPLHFRSIPAVCLYIEYTTDSRVGTAWYQCKFSGRQIMEMFPNYRGIKRDALVNSPNELYVVIYGQIKMSDGRYYIYAVMEIDPFYPLYESDRSYPQMLIYRDRVRPGEADGRGIGFDLMPAILDLNKTLAYATKNLAFKANPPMFYDTDAYFNPYSVRQWAGAMIARRPQGRNPLEPLMMPEHPDVYSWVKDSREYVLKGFQVDPLGELTAPVRSATEISIREARAQRTTSTDISRLINEQPRQIYEVAAMILSERKLLTKNRAVSIQNLKRTRFDYQSPLYDLQNQDNLNHLITSLQFYQQYYGNSTPIVVTKMAEVKNAIRKWLNLPSNLYVTDEELEGMIKQAGQLATLQAQGALPQPSTTAAPVKFPQAQGVTV